MDKIINLGASEWDDWRNRPGNDFIHQIQRGRLGQNIGISTGIKGLDRYTYGIHPGRYYLIGADSGVGKTTMSDFIFVLSAIEQAKRLKKKIKIFYCSFEIGKTDKIARWCSYYIFNKYKIRLPSDYFLGRIEGKLLTPEHFPLVQEAYAWIDNLMGPDGVIKFMDIMMHPTMIFEGIIDGYYAEHGTVKRDNVTGKEKASGKHGYVRGFTPNIGEEETEVILMIDHMALANVEQGLDTKGIMDRLSKYGVVLKNLFRTTIVMIQQFSTDLLSANRAMHLKRDLQAIIPTRLDFGDSKATFRDADVVLGCIKPGKDMAELFGWDLTPLKLGPNFVIMYLMKNRYGADSKIVPVFLDGITGMIYDIPCPISSDDGDEWYKMSDEINNVCQVYSPQ